MTFSKQTNPVVITTKKPLQFQEGDYFSIHDTEIPQLNDKDYPLLLEKPIQQAREKRGTESQGESKTRNPVVIENQRTDEEAPQETNDPKPEYTKEDMKEESFEQQTDDQEENEKNESQSKESSARESKEQTESDLKESNKEIITEDENQNKDQPSKEQGDMNGIMTANNKITIPFDASLLPNTLFSQNGKITRSLPHRPKNLFLTMDGFFQLKKSSVPYPQFHQLFLGFHALYQLKKRLENVQISFEHVSYINFFCYLIGFAKSQNEMHPRFSMSLFSEMLIEMGRILGDC